MLANEGLHLGIDAVNIRFGGGVTHLSQLLQAADPMAAGIRHVTLFANQATAAALPERAWLTKVSSPWMAASLPRRMLGQQFQMPQALLASKCDVLFSPGGTFSAWLPVRAVTMSQNMLPFEPQEAARFGNFSLMRLKFLILRHAQGRSFRRADGVIFLTNYARNAVTHALGGLSCPTALIPHGIEKRFLSRPRPQRALSECSPANPFKVLYVSILMPYKHQIQVARAASQLRAEGVPIEVRFIGAPWGEYGREFKTVLEELDPEQQFLIWTGAEPFEALHGHYQGSDAFVFASSCENLPNILIEAMAAGLPIACSKLGPMPEVLGDAGVYFDPETPSSIAGSLRQLATDNLLRTQLAEMAWLKAQTYSWKQCASDTFEFIAQAAQRKANKNV